MKGYISSGRMKADIEKDWALAQRDLAHRYFRMKCPAEAKRYLRRALRAWANYRHYRARIAA